VFSFPFGDRRQAGLDRQGAFGCGVKPRGKTEPPLFGRLACPIRNGVVKRNGQFLYRHTRNGTTEVAPFAILGRSLGSNVTHSLPDLRREGDSNPRYPCGYNGFQEGRRRCDWGAESAWLLGFRWVHVDRWWPGSALIRRCQCYQCGTARSSAVKGSRRQGPYYSGSDAIAVLNLGATVVTLTQGPNAPQRALAALRRWIGSRRAAHRIGIEIRNPSGKRAVGLEKFNGPMVDPIESELCWRWIRTRRD